MKIEIRYQNIHEIVESSDAAALLHEVKQQAAKRAPFLLRPVISSMGDLAFAAEAVKMSNQQTGRKDPPPASAQAFLDWAQERGYVTILEP
ncbi:MAG: hypothetical protein M3347_03855 [Armatimonadota bacterium]|nr:hypothetical protein [Armatimonadota bacterium]